MSVVGSVLELLGIIDVADRWGDLRVFIATRRRAFRRRLRQGQERLSAQLPKGAYRVPGLPSHRRIDVAARGMAIAFGGNVEGKRTLGGSVDDRIQRLTNELDVVVARVADLENVAALDARIRERAKDPVRGLILLVVGLVLLLAANLVGALGSAS